MGFIDEIKARAKADKKVIVLPETEDVRKMETEVTGIVNPAEKIMMIHTMEMN